MTLASRLNRPIFALLAVAAIAGGIRFAELSRPPELIFDENFYARDGCLYAGGTLPVCRIGEDERYWVKSPGAIDPTLPAGGEVGSWVHPPLGKWMVSLGIEAFGMTPFGWRFMAAVVGTLTVVLLAGIAQLMWHRPLWTFVTGLLLATESLSVVQSRTALLDGFLAFWVVLGFLAVILDRQWIERRDFRAAQAVIDAAQSDGVDVDAEADIETATIATSPFWRPWRLVAGLAFGAAIATKWSGATALTGAVLVSFLWERTRRKAAGSQRPTWRAFQQEALGLVMYLAIVPFVVYLIAYWRWWFTIGIDFHQWATLQVKMEQFHASLSRYKEGTRELVHPYLSEPWSWPFMSRPVDYAFEGPGASVLAIGNPAIFWTSVLTVPYLAIAWVRRRDWRRGMLLIAILSQYLPWFRFTGRVQFFFYMTPIVPFIVLAAVCALRDLAAYRPVGATSRPFVPLVVGLVLVSVILFVFFYPILTGVHLSEAAWRARMWFPGWV